MKYGSYSRLISGIVVFVLSVISFLVGMFIGKKSAYAEIFEKIAVEEGEDNEEGIIYDDEIPEE